MRGYFAGVVLAAALTSAGCAQVPTRPTVAVAPGYGTSHAVFQNDQRGCAAAANRRSRGHVNAANNQAVGSALLSTAFGAAMGGLDGGRSGASYGAVAGASEGMVNAAEMGAGAQYNAQQIYDMTYAQCMSARGHQVGG